MTRDPDEIREGIEQTQQELSADVDALTDKLSPQRVVHRQADRARAAMRIVKQNVAQKASAPGTAGGTPGTVAAAARRSIQANPVPVGLVIAGASWLLAWLLWPARTGSGRRR
jgi:hypothetical protein